MHSETGANRPHRLGLRCVGNRWCENGAPARDPIIGEHEENNHMVVTAIDICFRKRINDSLLLVPAR